MLSTRPALFGLEKWYMNLYYYLFFFHSSLTVKAWKGLESCSECVKTVNEASESKDKISSHTHAAQSTATVW